MPLVTGTRLDSYEIVAMLGVGGMGEVYRARDTKLGREVAIKVLPEAFATDPDRVARFKREARVLASLNQPNIAARYGMEESNGHHFLMIKQGTAHPTARPGIIVVQHFDEELKARVPSK